MDKINTMTFDKTMKIDQWDKQTEIFGGHLDPVYRDLDFCEVYYIAGKGFAVLNFKPRYALYDRLNIPEIQDVFVLHDHRGQGIASALIRHCESCVHDGDMVGISVPVSPEFGAAQRLYYKLGYMPDGNGVSYNREMIMHNSSVKLDDNLCLMMVKDLK